MKQLNEEEMEAKNIVSLDEVIDLNGGPKDFVCEYSSGACDCKRPATYMVDHDVSFWCDEHMVIMKEKKNYIQG